MRNFLHRSRRKARLRAAGATDLGAAGLVLTLVLGACMAQSGDPPGGSSAGVSPSGGKWMLEAEGGRTPPGQAVADLRTPGPVWVMPVQGASAGQVVRLAAEGATLQLSVPASLVPGLYRLTVHGYGELHQGAPRVSVRRQGQELAQVELASGTLRAHNLGNFSFRPGDILELTYLNDAYGGPGQDRNAVIDAVSLGWVAAQADVRPAPVAAPAPAQPPVPAPAAPTPTAVAAKVSVRDFGARGDGRTDDTAALQRALRSEASQVVFPAGTYLVSAPLVMEGQDRSVSAEGEAVLVASPEYRGGDGQQHGLLWLRQMRRVTVSGLHFDGRKETLGGGGGTRFSHNLFVTDSEDVTLRGLTLRGAMADGIAILTSKRVLTENNQVSGMGRHGIWTYRTVGQVHRGNTVVGPGRRVVSGDRNLGGLGLLATLGGDFTATGNTLRNISDTATKTEGLSDVVYRDNTVDVFGKDGIKVQPYPPEVQVVSRALVEGNRVADKRAWRPDGSGYILLQSVQGGVVRGNTVVGSGGQGPDTPWEEDAVRVNAYGGGAPSTGITLENNVLDHTRRGVRVESEGAVIRGNRITASPTWARSALIIGASNVLVQGNTFEGPVIGVLLDRDVRATQVTGNTFRDHEDAAIYADNNNPGTVLSGNRFEGRIGLQVKGPFQAR